MCIYSESVSDETGEERLAFEMASEVSLNDDDGIGIVVGRCLGWRPKVVVGEKTRNLLSRIGVPLGPDKTLDSQSTALGL